MSKLNLKISYKNACILKHALEQKLKLNKADYEICKCLVHIDDYDKFVKEYEEEERALIQLEEQIESEKYRLKI